jgi:hypothetical protein
MIGTRFVLHKNFKEFVEVKVIELKDVPCMWGGRGDYKGYKAVDSEGLFYYCNWSSFPSNSMSPMSNWISGKLGSWINVIGNYYDRFEDLEKIANSFPKTIGHCKKHKVLFTPKWDCYYCTKENVTKLETYKPLD